jgi:hypothetical protein
MLKTEIIKSELEIWKAAKFKSDIAKAEIRNRVDH